MNRRDLLIRAGLLAGGLGGAWWLRENVLWRDPGVNFPADGSSGWLPYDEPRASVPTVLVSVAGQTIRALVDSGAEYSVIDRGLFDLLGMDRAVDLPLVAYGVGGGAQMGRGTTLSLSVGAMRVEKLRTAILALGPLAMRDGLSAPLILGQDLLGKTVLELDTVSHRLRFLRADDHVPPTDARPILVSRSGTALSTEVTVEGATVQAVVDTGASALLALGRDAAASAGLLDGRPTRRTSSIVLGGAIAAEVVLVRTVTVGDRLYRDAEVPIYANTSLPGFPDALLGMEAFEGRTLVMDLGRGQLHVAEGQGLRVEGY